MNYVLANCDYFRSLEIRLKDVGKVVGFIEARKDTQRISQRSHSIWSQKVLQIYRSQETLYRNMQSQKYRAIKKRKDALPLTIPEDADRAVGGVDKEVFDRAALGDAARVFFTDFSQAGDALVLVVATRDIFIMPRSRVVGFLYASLRKVCHP